MNIGVLGTGFGAYHASIYKKLDCVNSIAVFGRDKDKLPTIRKDLGVEVTSSIESIIDNKDIDLVDVCLPSHLHKEYAIEALKKGKNVFCETPVSLNLEDAIAMKETAEKYGRKVFVDLFIKHEYPYEFLYKITRENTLGRLKALHIRRKTPPLWGDLSLDKITTNLMIHEFDFVSWLLGTPNVISATGVNGNDGESHVSAILNYDDSFVEIQSSSMMPDYHPFTVGYEAIFENGTLEFFENGYKDREEKSLMLFTDSSKKVVNIPKGNCFEKSIKHVIKCCNKDIPTNLGIEDAISSLKLALQVKDILIDTQK